MYQKGTKATTRFERGALARCKPHCDKSCAPHRCGWTKRTSPPGPSDPMAGLVRRSLKVPGPKGSAIYGQAGVSKQPNIPDLCAAPTGTHDGLSPFLTIDLLGSC